VSTPRSLSLDNGVQRATILTPRGDFAALVAEPLGPMLGSVVFVPGFTGSKEDFLHILAPVAAAGFRAIAYDQRGQYESAVAADSQEITLDLLAEDLVAVIGEVAHGGQVHVVGHSFGGLVSQVTALNHSDALASLVLMCTGPGALPTEAHDLLNSLIQAVSAGMSLDDVWLIKDQLDRADGRPLPSPEVHEFLRVRFTTNHPQALTHKAGILMTAPDQSSVLARHLADNQIKALVLYGVDDDAWNVADQDQMAVTLGADVVVIEQAAHSPAVENVGATTAALVDFWERATKDRQDRV